jgi:hypothetical protein
MPPRDIFEEEPRQVPALFKEVQSARFPLPGPHFCESEMASKSRSRSLGSNERHRGTAGTPDCRSERPPMS